MIYSEMNYSNQDLRKQIFSEVDLSAACFRACNLRGAFFSDCDLSNTVFTGALLKGARFDGCNLKNATFEGAELNWTEISGESTLPEGIELRGPEWLRFVEGACLIGAPLKGAFIYKERLGGDLRKCSAMDVSFNRATVVNADFRGANLFGADFMGCEIGGARWKGAVWSSTTKWEGGPPDDAIFIDSNVDLTEVNLSGVYLGGANLKHANLRKADLRKACLFRSDLSCANLEGARLEGARFDRETKFPDGYDPGARGAFDPGKSADQ